MQTYCGSMTSRARRTWTVVLVVIAVLALGGWFARTALRDEPTPASWVLAPSAAVTPASTDIPVLVTEAACTGGQLATGRIIASITYDVDTVTVDLRTKPPPAGDHDCQAVTTPYTVRLSEPLGDRQLVDPHAARPGS
jgi:hypothetical protein